MMEFLAEERIVWWCGARSALAKMVPRKEWPLPLRLPIIFSTPRKAERFFWGARRSDWDGAPPPWVLE